MNITIISAIAKNNVIGKDGKMPWHLPLDLKHFKDLTLGYPVIMGRKTYESIGMPLKERLNIVVSNKNTIKDDTILITKSLDEAIDLSSKYVNSIFDNNEDKNIFIIGGQMIYEQALPKASKLELTIINKEFEGDSFFPKIDFSDWKLINKINNKYEKISFNYETYIRIK